MQIVDMEVQDVETSSTLANLVEQQHLVGNGIPDVRIESQGPRRAGDQLSGRDRVSACKQCDLVPLPDQLLGQIIHDPLRAAVEPWRYTFEQRSNLRDPHFLLPIPINSVRRAIGVSMTQ